MANLNRIQTLVFILVFTQFSAWSQHSLGVKAAGGLSKVTTLRPLTNTESKFIFAPSGQAGLFYKFNFGRSSSVGAELLFSQIEGRENMKSYYSDLMGNLTAEYFTTKLDYHLSCLSLPVYYGFTYREFTIHLGGQVSYVLKSRGHWITEACVNNETIQFEDEGELNLDGYDFGPRAGLMFNLSKQFAIEASYYYGLNNILANPTPEGWDWKVQQMMLGLRYKLWRAEKKEKDTN